MRRSTAMAIRVLAWTALSANILPAILFFMPVSRINSRLWNIANVVNGDLREELGWEELTQTTAQIRDSLTHDDRAHLGILAGNYGEAGRHQSFRKHYGLPRAISGINSFWERGYGESNTQPYRDDIKHTHCLADIAELNLYYGKGNNELQLPMDFLFTTINKLSPADFRKQIAAVDSASGWPTFVISNHDIIRSYDRYGDGQHNDQIAKLMAGLYLTLRGTPIMYYGEEIGMKTTPPTRKEDVKDPIGRTGWPKEKGRDGERTPMQWDESANGGFSTAAPWLPVPATAKTHNVADESKDADSVLAFYKKVLKVRHTNKALLDGNYTPMNENDQNVLSYLRVYKGQAVLVALNMSGAEQKVSFDLTKNGFASAKGLVMTSKASASGSVVTLEPYGVFIGQLAK